MHYRTSMKILSQLIGIFLCATAAIAADAQKPRIALLLSDNGKHHDEFDAALNALGWSADRYPCKPENMKALAGKLGEYDMLITAPLFNYGKAPLLPGDDRKAFVTFLENGGLIAVTDGSYPGVRAWLADIHPALGGLETDKCNSSQWAANGVTADADPPHPLRFFPSRIHEPNSWPHFLKPAEGSAWRIVASCSEWFPVTFAQPVGKGLVSLSALRQPSAKQLVNFYACQQLGRAGISLKSFDLPAPTVGEGKLRLTFAGDGVKKACGFVYEIIAENGTTQRFERNVSGAAFELPHRITLRGPATARLLFKRDGRQTLLFEREIDLPQLLAITPNAYRGILSTARRGPTVSFGISLAPDQEKLEGATLTLTVVDPSLLDVSVTRTVLPANNVPLTFRQSVPLAATLRAGSYNVLASLTDAGNKKLAQAQVALKMLAPRPAQTIVDEDGTLLVNGKPFFPVGLYHVPPDDFAEVAKLGINTVQFWSWSLGVDPYGVSRGLAAASAKGLKAVYELNHKNKEIFRNTARQLADNPAILMWYGLDEPSEGSYALAATLRDTFHEEDVHHPVYTVSCRPDLYAEQAAFADVFAIDPYGKPQAALDCLLKAASALGGQKPLIMVPGVFGKETADELRATAYLALAHDARGILWYPWKQSGGGTLGAGLKNSPEQQKIIAELCSEITALTPALTAPRRYPFASEDGKLRALLCITGGRKVLLLVNPTPEKLETQAVLPAAAGLDKASAKAKDFFKKRDDVLELKSGRFHITLNPYETRVYAW